MQNVEVAIVGAGPTGLALACELRLAGVSCTVLERRAEEPNLTRAFAVHSRTLELLDARGLADDLVTQGIVVREVAPTPGAVLKLEILQNRYPFLLLMAQSRTELMLEKHAREMGAQIVRGCEVTGLAQDGDGVTLNTTGGEVRAKYVVGTDGAHSAVRDLVGVQFVGKQYETHILLADVQLARPPQETLFGVSNPNGLALFVPFGDAWFRAIVWDRSREQAPLQEPVTLAELQGSFRRITGDDYGMGEPRWSTRFLSERRQAERYRVGRVFLAGDAAHVHSPIGGQGMNTGIQDAFNLGWKLAAVLRGRSGDELLDSYQAERHPVGESVLKITDTLFNLVLSGSKLGAAVRRAVIRNALKIGKVRQNIAGRLSGIGISYKPLAGTHKMIGQRMPDLTGVKGRLYEAMREGKFVLVGAEAGAWADEVVSFEATSTPPVVLVRPDGYVAWAADRVDDAEVTAALKKLVRAAAEPPRDRSKAALMPPVNTARRNRLTDAAMEILASHGARGLTHRAVDTATGEPPGTTSRYFRTRDALLLGVVERAREQHFDDLRQAAFPALDKAALAERLSAIVLNALTVNRPRHLAMAELFLEATRRPGLRQAMTETRASQIQLISNLHRAAGVEISQHEATLLVATITGLVLVALTTPGVL